MKLLTLCAGVFFMTSPLAAQSKVFDQTVNLPSGGLLKLDASRGSVRLTAWDRDQVEIHARIEADSTWDSGYARRAVDATTVDVSTTFKNEVAIRGNYTNVPGDYWLFGEYRRTPSIHYEIRAPRHVDLRLNIDRSNSLISGFEGRVDLEADRSRIDAADLSSAIDVAIDRGGDSSFKNIRGSMVVEADRTNLRIELAKLDASSRIEVDRGDVDMAVSNGQGFNLDTSLTRRSSIDTSYPIQTRSYRRDKVSGPVNGGGPRLAIQVDRGRVRLR